MGVETREPLPRRVGRRDVDQIKADLESPSHLARYKNTKAAEDLPGLGCFYCVPCAKWFESETAITGTVVASHTSGGLSSSVKSPYTQKEAEAAVGIVTESRKQTTTTTTEAASAEDAPAGDVVMS